LLKEYKLAKMSLQPLSASSGHKTDQAGEQGKQTDKAGRQTSQTGQSTHVPALTATIFVLGTNITNIHSKTGSTCL